MSLLKISYWVEKWKNFENRLIFGEVMGKSLVSRFFDSRCIWMLCKICKVNRSVTCLSQKYFLPKVIVQTHTDLHNRSTAVPWRQNGRHQVYSRQNWPLSSCYRLMIGYRSPWWKFVSHHQTEREYATVWNQFFEMAANCHPFHFRRRPCRVLPNRQTSWWLITPSRARAGFYPVTN